MDTAARRAECALHEALGRVRALAAALEAGSEIVEASTDGDRPPRTPGVPEVWRAVRTVAIDAALFVAALAVALGVVAPAARPPSAPVLADAPAAASPAPAP